MQVLTIITSSLTRVIIRGFHSTEINLAFVGENKRGLEIHESAKHKNDIVESDDVVSETNRKVCDEAEEVTLNVFVFAIEVNLSRSTEVYKAAPEHETDAVVSVDKVWMSDNRKHENGYIGKFLAMEIKLVTNVCELWKKDIDFRHDLFETINEQLDSGEIVENRLEEEKIK